MNRQRALYGAALLLAVLFGLFHVGDVSADWFVREPEGWPWIAARARPIYLGNRRDPLQDPARVCSDDLAASAALSEDGAAPVFAEWRGAPGRAAAAQLGAMGVSTVRVSGRTLFSAAAATLCTADAMCVPSGDGQRLEFFESAAAAVAFAEAQQQALALAPAPNATELRRVHSVALRQRECAKAVGMFNLTTNANCAGRAEAAERQFWELRRARAAPAFWAARIKALLAAPGAPARLTLLSGAAEPADMEWALRDGLRAAEVDGREVLRAAPWPGGKSLRDCAPGPAEELLLGLLHALGPPPVPPAPQTPPPAVPRVGDDMAAFVQRADWQPSDALPAFRVPPIADTMGTECFHSCHSEAGADKALVLRDGSGRQAAPWRYAAESLDVLLAAGARRVLIMGDSLANQTFTSFLNDVCTASTLCVRDFESHTPQRVVWYATRELALDAARAQLEAARKRAKKSSKKSLTAWRKFRQAANNNGYFLKGKDSGCRACTALIWEQHVVEARQRLREIAAVPFPRERPELGRDVVLDLVHNIGPYLLSASPVIYSGQVQTKRVYKGFNPLVKEWLAGADEHSLVIAKVSHWYNSIKVTDYTPEFVRDRMTRVARKTSLSGARVVWLGRTTSHTQDDPPGTPFPDTRALDHSELIREISSAYGQEFVNTLGLAMRGSANSVKVHFQRAVGYGGKGDGLHWCFPGAPNEILRLLLQYLEEHPERPGGPAPAAAG